MNTDNTVNNDLHSILYISNMEKEYSKKETIDMLKLFRQGNKKNNISGLMLYYERNIIQYIEGNKKDVYKLYNSIRKDIRHYNIIKVMDECITDRLFRNWDMNFKELSHNEFIECSLDKLKLDNRKVSIFFKQFLGSLNNLSSNF